MERRLGSLQVVVILAVIMPKQSWPQTLPCVVFALPHFQSYLRPRELFLTRCFSCGVIMQEWKAIRSSVVVRICRLALFRRMEMYRLFLTQLGNRTFSTLTLSRRSNPMGRLVPSGASLDTALLVSQLMSAHPMEQIRMV